MRMHIIAGIHRGKKLASLSGKATRPTSGKVREAIFNICMDSVADANVLDLFAGTGAFGLEALSRGAASAILVDSDRKGIEVIQQNIAACRESSRAKVFCTDITKSLRILRTAGIHFDLVFMDPPYHSRNVRDALINLAESDMLRKGAVIVVEHDRHEEIPTDIADIRITDQRKYGKTLVTFMTWM